MMNSLKKLVILRVRPYPPNHFWNCTTKGLRALKSSWGCFKKIVKVIWKSCLKSSLKLLRTRPLNNLMRWKKESMGNLRSSNSWTTWRIKQILRNLWTRMSTLIDFEGGNPWLHFDFIMNRGPEIDFVGNQRLNSDFYGYGGVPFRIRRELRLIWTRVRSHWLKSVNG